MSEFSAVVLAAGEGERLRPLTRNRPKPLLPAGNRPILTHVLDTLVETGIDDICIVVGYKHSRVQDKIGSTYRSASVEYAHQDTQLGSGHALLQAADVVDSPFVVVNGDQIVDPEMISAVVTAHEEHAGIATVAVLKDSQFDTYDGIKVEGGRAVDVAFQSDAGSEYGLNAGVYAFEPEVFETLSTMATDAEARTVPGLLKRLVEQDRTVSAVETDGLWVDANYPWDLLTVARQLFAHDVLIETEEEIPDSATVHESATFRGPVAIDEDAVVGPGAVLGPNVCLGENATVEANAVVENAVIDADVRVGPNATLIDAVLGQGVSLGAASTVAGGPGDVRVGTRVFEDEPLGAVIADRARLDGGVSVAPGTLVGPDVTAETGVTLRGTIDAGQEVVR